MSFDIQHKEIPEWKCHKTVRAFKIGEIVGTVITSSCGTWAVNVTSEFLSKNNLPGRDGYFVRYGDGYESFSPTAPFEEGYTLAQPEQPVPVPVDPGVANIIFMMKLKDYRHKLVLGQYTNSAMVASAQALKQTIIAFNSSVAGPPVSNIHVSPCWFDVLRTDPEFAQAMDISSVVPGSKVPEYRGTVFGVRVWSGDPLMLGDNVDSMPPLILESNGNLYTFGLTQLK